VKGKPGSGNRTQRVSVKERGPSMSRKASLSDILGAARSASGKGQQTKKKQEKKRGGGGGVRIEEEGEEKLGVPRLEYTSK